MPEDAAWCTLITRLVKTWFEINSLWLLAAIMAIINSCLLAVVVLQPLLSLKLAVISV